MVLFYILGVFGSLYKKKDLNQRNSSFEIINLCDWCDWDEDHRCDVSYFKCSRGISLINGCRNFYQFACVKPAVSNTFTIPLTTVLVVLNLVFSSSINTKVSSKRNKKNIYSLNIVQTLLKFFSQQQIDVQRKKMFNLPSIFMGELLIYYDCHYYFQYQNLNRQECLDRMWES